MRKNNHDNKLNLSIVYIYKSETHYWTWWWSMGVYGDNQSVVNWGQTY